jgi:hypothetical protein
MGAQNYLTFEWTAKVLTANMGEPSWSHAKSTIEPEG